MLLSLKSVMNTLRAPSPPFVALTALHFRAARRRIAGRCCKLLELKADADADADAGPANPVATVTCGFETTNGFGIEGRSITVEYDLFYIVNLYVLNSGQKLERLDERLDGWNKDLLSHVRRLETRKPVVMVGDLNVAHLDADIWNAEVGHGNFDIIPSPPKQSEVDL